MNVRTGQFDFTGSQSITLGYQRTFIYVSGSWTTEGSVEEHTHPDPDPSFASSAFRVTEPSGLATNQLAFSLANITAGATRTLNVPNESGTIALQGAITTSGLTQSTARILGRTTASTGAIEEIQIGSGLSLSAGELSATASGGIGGGTGSTDNAILRADGTGGSTAQDSAFVIADNYTASPNNTVNHASIQATGGTTNVSASIVPKGTGAFTLSVPDGTSAGGNARGANAVDLQTSRNNAARVASGANSVLGGTDNTASGTESVAFCGPENRATGAGTAVIGGREGQATNSFAVTFGGRANVASGLAAVVMGGRSQSSSGNSSIVAGGGFSDLTTAGNTASGDAAATLGGRNALADRFCLQAHASGRFAANGDAQRIRAILRCATTTNAAVQMALDGSTTYLTIPSGKVMYGEIYVVGVRAGGADVAIYRAVYAAKNIGGTSTEVFSSVTTDAATGTSLEVSTVDAGDYIRIRPTGVASQNWRWVAKVDMVEVGHG
jgi:hypothetical protein